MTSAERLTLSNTMEKAAMAGIGRAVTRAVPGVLNHMGNIWSNMGRMGRIGTVGAGLGGLYGGYKMLRPNNAGVLGQVNQAAQGRNNDLQEIDKGFNNPH